MVIILHVQQPDAAPYKVHSFETEEQAARWVSERTGVKLRAHLDDFWAAVGEHCDHARSGEQYWMMEPEEHEPEPPEDSTWRETVNGEPRTFHATLDDAIAWAIENKKFADLTNAQAVEYVKRFPLTDNEGEPHELWREITDCGCRDFAGHRFDSDDADETCHCGTKRADAETTPCPIEYHFCFTTVTGEDYDDEETTPEEFIAGWDIYRVEPNLQGKDN